MEAPLSKLIEELLRLKLMITILILIVLGLVVAGIGLAMFSNRQLPPGASQFNFSGHSPEGLFGAESCASAPDPSLERQTLFDRAAAGDHSTLTEARAMRDAAFYDSVLNALIERTSSCQQDFDSLVRHVLDNGDLPANASMAERALAQYKAGPGRGGLADTLHLAALSDDAAIFEKAVETILQLWSEDRIPDVSSAVLLQLFESEYWVLGAEARRSGPGFTLRRRLAEVRRQLAAAALPASIHQKPESLPEGLKEHSHE